MTSKRTIRQVAVALALLVAFLLQGTWALAGTTGGLGGYVTDDQGKPVAGASVKVLSPSQAANGTTDASGHFTFLALAPDTYTVSIVKEGYAPLSESGITVFADNQLALSFQLQRQLKTIANVTSTAAGSLVKSGVGSDVYNVNSATIAAASALGGGGNLNSAYSAISAVPGVNVTVGGMGWNQNVFVRGSQSYFTGYEYDGVPVNRAFDNYNASTESNLGLQELQVYTGGGPASNSSQGTSGFINQVIKTGTYPGYANFSGGIASDAFYHQAKVEAGGASPDRNFSYYVGLSGYDQAFRLYDNSNGAGLMGPGGIYSDYSYANAALPIATGSGAFAMCDQNTGATPASVLTAVNAATPGGNALIGAPWSSPGPGFCLFPYSGLSANTSDIIDRENVVNFHFGIPRKDGQRDDLQLLWNGSMLKTEFYSTVGDLGGYNQFTLAETGSPYVAGSNFPFYVDTYVMNAPFGAPVSSLTPTAYYEPDSPTDRAPGAQIPLQSTDSTYNDQGIVKLQYTHAIGDRAYARAFAYTFFSDWNLAGPTTSLNYLFGAPVGCCANNYLLNTHTAGGELQFSDQVNDKNLVQLTANYTTARVLRDNNTTNITAGNPFGIVSESGGTFTCWNSAANGDSPTPCTAVTVPAAGTVGNGTHQCVTATSTKASCNATGYFNNGAGFLPTVGPNAAAAGAQLINLWSGGTSASYNTVDPNFANVSLSDQWRPNDKLLIDGALRYEDFTYNMPASGNDPANQFYAQEAANYLCYNTAPGAGGAFVAPLAPGAFPPATPLTTNGDCNAAVSSFTGVPETTWVHPNGQAQDGITNVPHFSSLSPNSYNLNYWSLRFSATYTQSPDTVWRASAGRFVEPPISASVQYLNASGNNLGQWAEFMGLGFMSPFHNTPAMTSAQYDLSYEHHFRGTDMSLKLTPFYTGTEGYQEQQFIGPGYVTQVPVGRQRNYGAELAFTKGDFSKNGLSGSLAVTYTDSKVQYASGLINGLGTNQVSTFNQAICDYDQLAKGASPKGCSAYETSATQNYPCFTIVPGGVNTPFGTAGTAAACPAGTIANPYFNSPQQGLMDPNGWYPSTGNVSVLGGNTNLDLYASPWVTNLILNYRHDKWAITPSFQLVAGAPYGSPQAVQGVDPRLCQNADPTQAGNQCAYTSLIGQGATYSGTLYVPNWQTGSFDSVGQYSNPNIIVGNIALSYDITPKITMNVTVANLFHTCFGGSKEPWSSAYPPSSNICGYGINGAYVSNYQLGPGYLTPGTTSSYSAAANGTSLYPWQQQAYAPTSGSAAGFIPPPINVYVTFNVKL